MPVLPGPSRVAWFGRIRRGDTLHAPVLCTGSAGVPVAPDEAPTVDLYSASAKPTPARAIPVLDSRAVTGLFVLSLRIGEELAAGRWHAVVRWDSSGSRYSLVVVFEVLGDGDPSGRVLAIQGFQAPHASFLVQHRSDGTLRRGRNPRPK
jgi:hypothetical protein